MAGQRSGIVTPEAVQLEFEGASLGSRAPALLIDLLIQSAVFFAILLAGAGLSGQIGQVPEWVGVTLIGLLTFATVWGYPIAFETLWRGRTPGKAAMGLRVVTKEGAPVRFRHAAVRAVLTLVDLYAGFGAIGVVSILVTKRHQRLGDLVAGTLVLRERTAERPPTPVQFTVPAGVEGYAATVDPGGMTSEDYATVRSFLLRADSLGAAARTRLGTLLAQRLAAKLSHVPPEGVSPELFLVVAAARYQQRFRHAAQATPGPPPAGTGEPRERPGEQSSASAPGDGGFAPPS
ncbi:MAG: hypothetical protein GEU81_13065 [Nitriliruptorales bacterium]|nr:hypothetical protein [Nitriliruptorales bacterium]